MNKIYDRTFKVGVGIALFVFTVVNIISYFVAKSAYDAQTARFAHDPGVLYGVPYVWSSNLPLPNGTLLNLIFAITLCFIMGFLFKYVYQKVSRVLN